ncbi:hypothetical protein NE237_003054 [Protea cynaroides]|uniref:Uncharacterized protein n=1 Tax=Protea cynaroides TaxID=273540 RepID=A0A9Q0QS32_9MAGN|nr:hypothetical protein NE237_003054 [Protea cynaroides]
MLIEVEGLKTALEAEKRCAQEAVSTSKKELRDFVLQSCLPAFRTGAKTFGSYVLNHMSDFNFSQCKTFVYDMTEDDGVEVEKEGSLDLLEYEVPQVLSNEVQEILAHPPEIDLPASSKSTSPSRNWAEASSYVSTFGIVKCGDVEQDVAIGPPSSFWPLGEVVLLLDLVESYYVLERGIDIPLKWRCNVLSLLAQPRLRRVMGQLPILGNLVYFVGLKLLTTGSSGTSAA